jgi:tetratricopeptide (TPR) repeat protein
VIPQERGAVASSAAAPGADTADGSATFARGYLADARRRFPDNPYFVLAEVVAVEVAATLPADAGALSRAGRAPGFDRIAADVFDTDAERASPRARGLDQAARLLAPLTSNADVASEAHLRLGYIDLRFGRRASALDHFGHVNPDDADRGVVYLGHLFAGWVLAGDGRVDEAAAAYRAALAVIPHGRAATTLLTSLMLMNNKLDEAEQLSNEFLVTPPADNDPWWDYLAGDYRHYRALIGRLRDAIRPAPATSPSTPAVP